MDLLTNALKRLGYLWYIMIPTEHMYEDVSQVPDYYKEVYPAFIFVIVLEQFLHLIRGKSRMRLNDSVTNISQGILVELFKIPLYGTELILYTWIYNNWRIYSLPWNSVWTWLLCLITTEFCFYWMHRASHQISILWLFHEPHHSSEDYNLTTPLRLSVFTSAGYWMTYLPMALIIPPSTFFVHYQMIIIVQYWLHSEYIPDLGVLEYVFNTPSHHRVHHGRNRRCIDKNFGSILIVWDRLFGTFELEGHQEIKFGVTKPLQTFNPITVQTNHLQTILKRLGTVDGFENKLSLFFKGPGWSPGKPWLGNIEDILEPKNEQKYDPRLPKWLKIYILLHTTAMVIGYLMMMHNLTEISSSLTFSCSIYIVLTTISIGCLLDLSGWGIILEFLRCPLYFLLDAMIQNELSWSLPFLNATIYIFRSLLSTSFVFWILTTPFVLNSHKHMK